MTRQMNEMAFHPLRLPSSSRPYSQGSRGSPFWQRPHRARSTHRQLLMPLLIPYLMFVHVVSLIVSPYGLSVRSFVHSFPISGDCDAGEKNWRNIGVCRRWPAKDFFYIFLHFFRPFSYVVFHPTGNNAFLYTCVVTYARKSTFLKRARLYDRMPRWRSAFPDGRKEYGHTTREKSTEQVACRSLKQMRRTTTRHLRCQDRGDRRRSH